MSEIKPSDVKAFNRGYREALNHANTVGGMLPGDLEAFARYVQDNPDKYPILNLLGKP
jgi:hypothetical protein